MFGELASWVIRTLDGLIDEGDLAAAVAAAEEDTGLIDLQCGRTVFNDVPAKMRTELWLSQLHRDRGVGAAAVAQFTSLVRRPLPGDLLAEIEKDMHRTFPGHRTLSTPAGQRSMLRVLRAFAAFDPEVGYTQGMNFLAGLMLAYLGEADAFGALTLVMKVRGLRDLYLPDDGMALLQVRLWQLGRLIPPRLAAHLDSAATLPVLYAPSWFLTCFAADFPLSFAARVMDLVITDCYAAPLMKVAVHILERCEASLMATRDMEAMLRTLRQEVPRWPRAALHDLLTEALGRPWTARQAAVLEQINGAESVLQAVNRVGPAAAGGDVQAAGPGSPTQQLPPPERRPSAGSDAGGTEPATGAVQPASPAKLTPPPLPPPPGSRNARVDWDRWRPATPALAAVPADSLRIEHEIREVPLDESLSAALSSYASAQAAEAQQRGAPAQQGCPVQQAQQQGRRSADGAAAAAEAAPAKAPDRVKAAPATPEAGAPAPPLRSPFAAASSEPSTSVAPHLAAREGPEGEGPAEAPESGAPRPGASGEFGSFDAAPAGQDLGFGSFDAAPAGQDLGFGSTAPAGQDLGFGSFGTAPAGAMPQGGLAPRQHAGGAAPRSIESMLSWGASAESSVRHLLGGLQLGAASGSPAAPDRDGTVDPGPLGPHAAEFGSWTTAGGPARVGGAHAAPAPAAAGALSSPLHSATSKARLLQQEHLREFLTTAARQGSEEREAQGPGSAST